MVFRDEQRHVWQPQAVSVGNDAGGTFPVTQHRTSMGSPSPTRAAAGTRAAKWDPRLSGVAVGPRNPCSEGFSEELAPQV